MSKKLTTDDFIQKAKAVHGDLYNYSKVIYINSRTKVCIIDPEYGEWEQTPQGHLSGRGHPSRGLERTVSKLSLSKEEFIERAKIVHGDLYDYSKVVYINNNTPVTIIDPEYGEFEQTPQGHLSGNGCHSRSGWGQKNTEQFISEAREVHGDLYDYSKVTYINNATKVIIIDPEYGEFEQTPASHLSGQGSPYRADNILKTTEKFVQEAKAIHGDLYDYSKVIYKNGKTKVIIIDPEYGEFEQIPTSHLRGSGSPYRADNKLKTTEQFIKDAQAVHGNLYDYSKVKYINNKAKVCIIDPEYGEFWQRAIEHLRGQGHPSRTSFGFDPYKPAILYYLSILNGKAYKIGITNLSVEKRYCNEDKSKIKVLKVWSYPLGIDAYNEEQRIIKEFKDARYTGDDLLDGARTAEMFRYDVLGLDSK
jgi:serine/threonine-protein kinase RIO1